MQNDLFSEKKTSDRTSEKSHKSSEGSQKSAKKSWFSKLKPLHYYIGGATLLLVLAVTGFYYLSADLDDSPPSLTLGPAGLRGFIGTGVYVEFNEADILKTADFEDTEEINSGVQYFHYSANSTDKISWKQILSDIKPNDTNLRCVLAQYYPEEKTFKTYPVGPFGGTITVEDDELTSVFVNSGEGAILVCSRAYEMNTENDFLHASVPPAGSLPQLNQMQAGWNLGAVASTEALQSVVASCPQRLRAVWVQDDENSFEKFWAQADRTEVISDRDIRNLELNDDYHMVWFRLSGEPGMCVSTRAEREEAEECDPSRGVTSVSLDKLCTEEGVWIECDRAVLNTLAADGRFICNQNEIWQRCDFSSADSLNRDKNYLCQAPSVWKVCDRRSEGIRSLSGNYECRSGKWTLLTDRPVARPDAVVECGRLGNLSDDRTKVCTSSGYLTCDSSFEGLLSPEGWHECVNGRWVLATVSGAGVCTPGTLNASTTGYCTESSEYLTCDSATAGSKSADGSFECRSGKWVAVMPAGGSANTQLALLVSDVNDWHSEVLALQASAETDLNTATLAKTSAQANMDIINSSINTLQGQFDLLTFGGIKDFSFAKFLYANILLASNGGETTYNKAYFEGLLSEIEGLRGNANSKMTQLSSSFVSIQAKYNALNAEVEKVGKVKTEIAGANDLTLATSLHAGARTSTGKVKNHAQKIAELRETLSSLSAQINSLRGQVATKGGQFQTDFNSYSSGAVAPPGAPGAPSGGTVNGETGESSAVSAVVGQTCTPNNSYDTANDLMCLNEKWAGCTRSSATSGSGTNYLQLSNDSTYLCDNTDSADFAYWRKCNQTLINRLGFGSQRFVCSDKWLVCQPGGSSTIDTLALDDEYVCNTVSGLSKWVKCDTAATGQLSDGGKYVCESGKWKETVEDSIVELTLKAGDTCSEEGKYDAGPDLLCYNSKWKECSSSNITDFINLGNHGFLCDSNSNQSDKGKWEKCGGDGLLVNTIKQYGNSPSYLCEQTSLDNNKFVWNKCSSSNTKFSADEKYYCSNGVWQLAPQGVVPTSAITVAEVCTSANDKTISQTDISKYCLNTTFWECSSSSLSTRMPTNLNKVICSYDSDQDYFWNECSQNEDQVYVKGNYYKCMNGSWDMLEDPECIDTQTVREDQKLSEVCIAGSFKVCNHGNNNLLSSDKKYLCAQYAGNQPYEWLECFNTNSLSYGLSVRQEYQCFKDSDSTVRWIECTGYNEGKYFFDSNNLAFCDGEKWLRQTWPDTGVIFHNDRKYFCNYSLSDTDILLNNNNIICAKAVQVGTTSTYKNNVWRYCAATGGISNTNTPGQFVYTKDNKIYKCTNTGRWEYLRDYTGNWAVFGL